MAVTAIFIMLALAENTQGRLNALLAGYIAGAVVVGLIGITGVVSRHPRHGHLPDQRPRALDLQGRQRVRPVPDPARDDRPDAISDRHISRAPHQSRDTLGYCVSRCCCHFRAAPGAILSFRSFCWSRCALRPPARTRSARALPPLPSSASAPRRCCSR